MRRTFHFEFIDSSRDYYCTTGGDGDIACSEENPQMPDWARLQCNRCPHCTLDAERYLYCPPAMGMAPLVEHFARSNSFDKVTLHVIMEAQQHSIITDLQSALAYLYPAILMASACPYAPLIRPLEKFAKPFPDVDDILYYVLSLTDIQKMLQEKQTPAEVPALRDTSRDMAQTFLGLLGRLRLASEEDANINAMIKNIQWSYSVLYSRETILNRLRKYF